MKIEQSLDSREFLYLNPPTRRKNPYNSGGVKGFNKLANYTKLWLVNGKKLSVRCKSDW
jgi:hypothetical protein